MTFTWGQVKSKINMFYPDEWFESIEKPLAKNDVSYFGIYERVDKSTQSFKALHFQLEDTLVDEPAYGLSRVLFIDSVRPLFVVSGIEGISNNTEISGVNLNGLGIFPGKSVSYDIGQKSYTVFATGNYLKNAKNEIALIIDYKVFIQVVENKRTTKQILYEANSVSAWSGGGFEGGVTLRWIGDLDNNNGVDIILTTSSDYRSWDVILLMTSQLNDKIVSEISRYSGSAP